MEGLTSGCRQAARRHPRRPAGQPGTRALKHPPGQTPVCLPFLVKPKEPIILTLPPTTTTTTHTHTHTQSSPRSP